MRSFFFWMDSLVVYEYYLLNNLAFILMRYRNVRFKIEFKLANNNDLDLQI